VEQKGIKFFYKTSLNNIESIIFTDREKLYAILTNLVKNAIKYTDFGSITLGYELKENNTGKYLQFYVKDTGIGIPKDRQDAIFERFIQADITDKMARQGAGLGLSITKAYLEMLGGKIWVESNSGEGSAFYFTLPYTSSNFNPVSVNTAAGNTSEPDASNNISLKILIAEDDESSEILLELMVENFSKQILKVSNGIEVIETCRQNPDIDLILMDIQMPIMGGYEATSLIRQFNKEVIIIAQTAYGLAGDREKAIQAGCTDYISKPIDSQILKNLILKYFLK